MLTRKHMLFGSGGGGRQGNFPFKRSAIQWDEFDIGTDLDNSREINMICEITEPEESETISEKVRLP